MDPGELERAVEIFTRAFADEHGSRYRGDARPFAFVQIWRFLRTLEPAGFLAVREGNRLAGYAIFTSSLRRVQRRAVTTGAVFHWALAALRGGFALRPSAIWRILLNKLYFVRSAGRFRKSGDAQLLNIAVDPAMQSRGAGRALIRSGIEAMRRAGVREIRLEVRPWNAAAVNLYRRTGWQEAGRTRDAEGEWLVMICHT